MGELREKVEEEAFGRYREEQRRKEAEEKTRQAEEEMHEALWVMLQEQQERAHAEYEMNYERARADALAQQVHTTTTVPYLLHTFVKREERKKRFPSHTHQHSRFANSAIRGI